MMSVRSTDSARIASCAPSGRSLHALVCFRARSTHPFNSWTSHTHWQNSRGSTQTWRWPPQPFTSLRSCITFQLANNITPTSSSPRCKLLPLLCMNLMWVCFHSASQELPGKERDLLLCIGPELSRGHTAACTSTKGGPDCQLPDRYTLCSGPMQQQSHAQRCCCSRMASTSSSWSTCAL